jgi:hypothetical protein
MAKYVSLIAGLALLWSIPFPGQAPMAAMADGAVCCGCCPHCGCKLVPVCHVSCTTKKETTYKYTCNCDTLCVPGVTRLCDKCGKCDGSNQGAGSGEACTNGGDNSCPDGCKGGCKCRVHEVKHLVKVPSVKEVPVKKCTVEWVCPHCDCHGDCTEGVAPSNPAPAPVPAPPVAGKAAANLAPDNSAAAKIEFGPRS